MKRSILFSIVMSIIAIGLVGCCDCRKLRKLEKPLLGTTWQLVQLMARDVEPEADCYTLVLRSDGNLSGKGDSNLFTASYEQTESRELRIGELGTTRRYTPNHQMENAYFDMLQGVTHYEMDADHMLLLSNGTLVAIMKAATNVAE